MGFLGSLVIKNLPANAGDTALIPTSRRSFGGGQGNLLQSSCLENPMDRGGWWAPWGRKEWSALDPFLGMQIT